MTQIKLVCLFFVSPHSLFFNIICSVTAWKKFIKMFVDGQLRYIKLFLYSNLIFRPQYDENVECRNLGWQKCRSISMIPQLLFAPYTLQITLDPLQRNQRLLLALPIWRGRMKWTTITFFFNCPSQYWQRYKEILRQSTSYFESVDATCIKLPSYLLNRITLVQ